MVAAAYDHNPSGAFMQSFLHVLLYPHIKWIPFLVPGAAIHLSRHSMIAAARAHPDVDFLVMADSDQTLNSLTIPRLVGHNVPVVAPGIVQRNGDPIPVAYRENPRAAGQKNWTYEPLLGEILAYLSLFNADRFGAGAGDVILPIEPDFPPDADLAAQLSPAQLAGLQSPLLLVDALGAGVLCLRRDVLLSLEPDPDNGLFLDFAHGGEDFSLCRNIRRQGWGGLTTPGHRGPGLFLDRGCWSGHVTNYAKGPADLIVWSNNRMQQLAEQEASVPPAAELLARLDAAQMATPNGSHQVGPIQDSPSWLRETALPLTPTAAGAIP